MVKRKTLTGAGASIAVMATLAGAPSVSAQECIDCEPQQPGQAAFFKISDLGFPGATQGVFHKDNVAQPPAFWKLSELKFPGATEGVFGKHNVGQPPAFWKLSELKFPGVTAGVFSKGAIG